MHEPEIQDEKQGTHCEVLRFRPSIQGPNRFPDTGPTPLNHWIPMYQKWMTRCLQNAVRYVVYPTKSAVKFAVLWIRYVNISGSTLESSRMHKRSTAICFPLSQCAGAVHGSVGDQCSALKNYSNSDDAPTFARHSVCVIGLSFCVAEVLSFIDCHMKQQWVGKATFRRWSVCRSFVFVDKECWEPWHNHITEEICDIISCYKLPCIAYADVYPIQ